jgi:NitT/TauT family transport system substrate-binding protein
VSKTDALAGMFMALMLVGPATAAGEGTLNLAVGQRGNWNTSVSEVGQRAGIFQKHGLILEIVYTNGAGETQQAVISGSVDIGVAADERGMISSQGRRSILTRSSGSTRSSRTRLL